MGVPHILSWVIFDNYLFEGKFCWFSDSSDQIEPPIPLKLNPKTPEINELEEVKILWKFEHTIPKNKKVRAFFKSQKVVPILGYKKLDFSIIKKIILLYGGICVKITKIWVNLSKK